MYFIFVSLPDKGGAKGEDAAVYECFNLKNKTNKASLRLDVDGKM